MRKTPVLLKAVFNAVLLLSLTHLAAADIFTVDTTSDANLSACTTRPGDCSLRGAINRANANTVEDAITFNIPSIGFQTIAPVTGLPALTDDRTLIDGNSQPGYNGLPLIVLTGAGSQANGLSITAAGCRVRGLTLYGWENAIQISGEGADVNRIEGCFIGTDSYGAAVPAATNNTGVAITTGADNNIIGGTTPAQRNIISANRTRGIWVSGPGTTRNRILGNYIGPDRYGRAFGQEAQRNNYGVTLEGASENNIGGAEAGAGNLISGNRADGVRLFNSHNNSIAGNRIGTDAAGRSAIGNGSAGHGIYVTASDHNIIGGAQVGARNIISGNLRSGVLLYAASHNVVAGNYIGLDATGSRAVPNSFAGVGILGSPDNTRGNTIGGLGGIGGVAGAGASGNLGNVISGNDIGVGMSPDALSSFFNGPKENVVVGNFIGTNARGTEAIPNRLGVFLERAERNLIGRPTKGARNVVAGNSEANIKLFSTRVNAISGNFIGTNSSGTAPLGDSSSTVGILLENSFLNTVGGPAIEARNIVSGHAGHGIELVGELSFNNVVQNNYIGLDARGSSAVPNGKSGIALLNGAKDNSIGGEARNIISGNREQGILISGAGTDNNRVAGNFIGLNARGDGALGNIGGGVVITQGAQHCTLGSTNPALRNVISGNGSNGSSNSYGIRIEGDNTELHTILNCYIGTDATGNKSGFGNNGAGIVIFNSNGHRIGVPGAPRNVISGNARNNVEITNANRNIVQNNFIGPKADGSGALVQPTNAITFTGGILIQGSNFYPDDASTGNLIGGTQEGTRNVISGNQHFGISSLNRGVTNTLIQGNFIGTNAAGDSPISNGRYGILDGGTGTLVGGTTPQARNVISGNGITLNSGLTAGIVMISPNGRVQGNFIGTNARGTEALPNLGVGVYTGDGVTVGGETNRPGTGAGNVIAGNGQSGVVIDQSHSPSQDNVRVLGNLIGTNLRGTQSLPNGAGVIVYGGRNAAIGSGEVSGRNIISGNRGPGVQTSFLENVSLAFNTRIQGNYIGTDISGQAALPNGRGIQVDYSYGTIIGGATARPGTGAGNLISGNLSAGVYVGGEAATMYAYGNAIGVAADGTTPLPNTSLNGVGGWGISLNGLAYYIGAPGELSNLIAHNEAAGVAVGPNGRSNGYSIRGNRIFNNGGLGIDLGDDGVTLNDEGDVDTGANDLQNYPVLLSATQSAPSAPLVLRGTLDSTPDQQFTVDVYASSVPDPSGYGEGEIYLGSFPVSTSGGAVSFSQSLDVDADLEGQFISLTASNVEVPQTSEFSPAIEINNAPTAAQAAVSSVTGAAYASSNSIILTFDAAIQSANNQTFSIKKNGVEAKARSVETNGKTVTILLPQNSLQEGDELDVSWRDLLARDGERFSDGTTVVAE